MSKVHPVKRLFGFTDSHDIGISDAPVEEVARTLSELGYSAVEWSLKHFHPKGNIEELKDLVRIPERYGMVVSEVFVQQDLVTFDASAYEERINIIEDSIKAAERVGISTLNVFSGPAPWIPRSPRLGFDITEGQAWKLVFDAYDRILPMAEKHNIYLAFEPVYSFLVRDYYTLKEFLDHYDSPNMMVNFDPSHFQLYGNDVAYAVRRLGKRIRHVHLKDVVGKPGAFFRDFANPLIGEGVVDWQAFTYALDEVGYHGVLSIECESFNYYERLLNKDWKRLAAICLELAKQVIPPPAKDPQHPPDTPSYWGGIGR